MSKRTIVVPALFVSMMAAVSALSACDESPDASALPVLRGCFADDQCNADELCVFRLCSPACGVDGSCESGTSCFDTSRGPACLRIEANACLDAKDCPLDSECVRGRCRNCGRGLCPSSDDPTDAGRNDAESGAVGTAGAGGSMSMCTAGALSCRENVVVRCDDAGQLRSERVCPFACRDGACVGTCVPGETRCSGAMRQRCDETGGWTTLETCRNACTPGGCADVCADGTRQCAGNTLTVCRAGRQIEVQRCEYVCRYGACSGSCAPGSRQCRNDGLATCGDDGSWNAPVPCLNACLNGACTGECAPGAQRCASNMSYQVCNGRGQWSGMAECSDQACVEGECIGVCTPGATRCEGAAALATCGADGQWAAPSGCPEQACRNGACEGSCTPGSARCGPEDARQTQLCSERGEWQDGVRCAPDEACVDGACSGECTPGTRRCVPGDAARFQVCGDAGEWGTPSICGEGISCTGEGACDLEACPTGQRPEWSPMEAGANPDLDDPRWGGMLDRFANASGQMMPAGYAIVYDRPSNSLTVTVRALGNDAPSPGDFVYFALASAAGTDGVAARIELAPPSDTPDPRPLFSIAGYELRSGAWAEAGGRRAWISSTSGWLRTDEVAWAVSFHADLGQSGLPTASEVRVAAGVHVENDAGPMVSVTPTSLDVFSPLGARAADWPLANLDTVDCTGRLFLP